MKTKSKSHRAHRGGSQKHAIEVEFVEVKSKRLGKRIKAVPVARSPSPARMASSSRRCPSPHAPEGSSFVGDEDFRPAKRARSGKVGNP